MNADIARAAHQIMHDRAVQNLEPARAGRLADSDVGDVFGVRISGRVVGNGSVGTRNSYRFAAKCLGEPQGVGNAIPPFFGQLQTSAALYVERRQWTVQAIREPLGV